MFKVTATANGYYGLKFRSPGEAFGIEHVEDFSMLWMDSDEPAITAEVKRRAHLKDEDGNNYAPHRRQAEDWLKRHNETADAPEPTRRVNTGGTDGVVGAEVPKPGVKLSAKDRIALANQISGRTDVKSAAEADTIIAAVQASGGSDNDDRTRDLSIDQSANAPLPGDPLDHDGNGKKGGAKAADDGDI